MDCFGCTSQIPLKNHLAEKLSFFCLYVCVYTSKNKLAFSEHK